jgi:hypothetical protein
VAHSKTLKKLAKESFGRLSVALALHDDIQDMAILIDCAPEVMVLALDRQHDLVEGATHGKLPAKPQSPLADRLAGHDDTPAGHNSSMSRKLSENRKYNHTRWLMISRG